MKGTDVSDPKKPDTEPASAETDLDKLPDPPKQASTPKTKRSGKSKPAADASGVKVSEADVTITAETPDTATPDETPAGQETAATEDPPQDAEPAAAADAAPAETVAETPQPPAPVVQHIERRGGFLPLVFGGVVAAGLGFIAGQANLFGLGAPDAPTFDASELIAANQDLTEQVDALTVTVAELEGAAPAAPDLSAVTNDLKDIRARLDSLEAAPAPEGTGINRSELREMEARVVEQQAQLDALLAQAQSAQADAAERQRATVARAALSDVNTALATGAPFDDALAAFEQSSDAAVPDALSAVAASGAPTLAAVQADVADAARAGLAAARASDTEGAAGVGDFLRRQLGARSVVPREGDDPDAVLSRLEAATRAGDLPAALAEADALPPAAQEAMSDWLSAAQARVDAVAAATALAQSVDPE
ncbi:MAG: hypothetical protein AAF218_07145 [Pseudomonadota bacterium]